MLILLLQMEQSKTKLHYFYLSFKIGNIFSLEHYCYYLQNQHPNPDICRSSAYIYTVVLCGPPLHTSRSHLPRDINFSSSEFDEISMLVVHKNDANPPSLSVLIILCILLIVVLCFIRDHGSPWLRQANQLRLSEYFADRAFLTYLKPPCHWRLEVASKAPAGADVSLILGGKIWRLCHVMLCARIMCNLTTVHVSLSHLWIYQDHREKSTEA